MAIMQIYYIRQTPIKHFNIVTSIWQLIKVHGFMISVVKVCAYVSKIPDEHEQNNIVDKLANLAALKGGEWQPDMLIAPAVSAVQATPVDVKQYQQVLWISDGELAPQLKQRALINVTLFDFKG